jgi:hypothetical protein
MNFQQAIKQCLAHKKVRRSCWEVGHYWTTGIDKKLINSVGENISINEHQVEARDWELYEEEKDFCLSNKIRCLGCGKPRDECESEFYFAGSTIRVKDVKEFINKLKDRLCIKGIGVDDEDDRIIKKIISNIIDKLAGDDLK